MENKFDIEDLSLPEIELIQVRAKINSFNSITDVCVHHKTQFIKDFSQHFGKLGESGLVGIKALQLELEGSRFKPHQLLSQA